MSLNKKNKNDHHVSESDSDESKFNANESDDNIEFVGEKSPPVVASEVAEQCQSNFFIEELTSDDEIFTFQCPQNLKVETLLEKRFHLKRKAKITNENGVEFQCQVLANGKESLTCVVPSRNKPDAKFVKLPVAGHIVVQNHLPVFTKFEPFDNTEEINFPSEFTPRHPLLGRDWEEHLNTAKKVIKKSKKAQKKSLKLKHKLFEAEMKKKNEHINKALSVKRKKT